MNEDPNHPLRSRDGPEPPADLFPEILPDQSGFEKKPGEDRSTPGVSDGWSPRVDIAEATMEYVLFVEVPGVTKDDISIERSGNLLSMFIEKRMPGVSPGCRFHKVERDFGASFRSFQIPPDASDAAPRWNVLEGVLTIRLDRLSGTPAVAAIENEALSDGQQRPLPESDVGVESTMPGKPD